MEIEIIKFLQASANGFYDAVFKIFSYAGSWAGFLVAIIVMFCVNKKYALVFGGTYGVATGINFLLKVIINRPRPFQVDPSIYNWLATVGQSMPSGHALSSIVIAIFVVCLVIISCKSRTPKILTGVIMGLYVLLVVISRMYLGQHFLSDLIVGLLLGSLFAGLGLLVYFKRGKINEYFRNHFKKEKQDRAK